MLCWENRLLQSPRSMAGGRRASSSWHGKAAKRGAYLQWTSATSRRSFGRSGFMRFEERPERDGVVVLCVMRAVDEGDATSSGGLADGFQSLGMLFQFRKRSEEHTSELQSRFDLVCRLLL